MDADLQDPPEAIPKMLELWRHGYQVVLRRKIQQFRLCPISHFCECVLPPLENDCIDRESAKCRRIPADGRVSLEIFEFVDGTHAIPSRVDSVALRKKHFDFCRAISTAARENELQFSAFPAGCPRWVCLVFYRTSLVGGDFRIRSTGMSLLVGGGYVAAWFLRPEKFGSGWPSLFVSIWFLGGVQLLFIGVVGEYLGRVLVEVQNRPLSWVDYD